MSETAGSEAREDDAPAPEITRRARDMGWRPRDEYTGARPWVDAEQFIERSERMLPLAAARVRQQDRMLEELRGTVREQQETLAAMVEGSRRAEIVGYKRAMRELQQRRAQAINDGDVHVVNTVEQEMQELGPEPKPVERKPPANGNGAPQPDPIVAAWARQNPWFQSNAARRAAAIAMMQEIDAETPNDPLEDRLEEVVRRMRQEGMLGRQAREAQPEDVEEPEPPPRREARAPAVSRSSDTPSRRPAVKPRSFDAMPADVRKQFDRQVKMLEGKGPPLTKDEFASYYWEQFPDEAA